MDTLFHFLPANYLLSALAAAVVAGIVKGMVGFAMPMILISSLGTFLDPQLALAGLIMPTLVANVFQALRQGFAAAGKSVQKFRVFLLSGLVAMLGVAQFVRVLPPQTMLLLIGVPVALFALIQLLGVRITLSQPSRATEALAGGFAGLIGGLSGVWGPPTVTYLTALGTEKSEHVRVQGVIYALGAVALALAHTWSGILNAQTLPFSLALVPPAILGMWIGGKVHDRINQKTFRTATLLVLLVAALNLIRRALLY